MTIRIGQRHGWFLATLIFGLAWGLGCVTPAGKRVPLGAGKREHLAKIARPARESGLELSSGEAGEFAFTNARQVPLGARAVLPINRPAGTQPYVPIAEFGINEKPFIGLIATASAATLVEYAIVGDAHLVPLAFPSAATAPAAGAHPPTRQALGASGEVHYLSALAQSVRLGDLRLYKVPVGIIDDERGFDALWWLPPAHYEMIVGSDLLQAFDHVGFRFQDGLLEVASGRYKPDTERLVAAVPLVQKFGVISVQAYIDGTGPYFLTLATAVDDHLWLPRRIASELAATADLARQTAPGGEAAVATMPSPTQRVHTLNIGGFEVENIPSTIATGNAPGDQPPFPLLGMRFLRDYNVTLDFTAKKIYLELP